MALKKYIIPRRRFEQKKMPGGVQISCWNGSVAAGVDEKKIGSYYFFKGGNFCEFFLFLTVSYRSRGPSSTKIDMYVFSIMFLFSWLHKKNYHSSQILMRKLK